MQHGLVQTELKLSISSTELDGCYFVQSNKQYKDFYHQINRKVTLLS